VIRRRSFNRRILHRTNADQNATVAERWQPQPSEIAPGKPARRHEVSWTGSYVYLSRSRLVKL